MFLLEDICDALSVEKVKINKLSFTSLKPPTKNSSGFSPSLFSWVLRGFVYVDVTQGQIEN